jgi:hypothetical protein
MRPVPAEQYARLDPRQYHGSVYGMVAARRGYPRPAGEWNFQEVTVKGPKIKVELNGTVIVDADVSKVAEFMGGKPHPGKDRTSGYFGFAGHDDPVAFRNVSIKPLDRCSPTTRSPDAYRLPPRPDHGRPRPRPRRRSSFSSFNR